MMLTRRTFLALPLVVALTNAGFVAAQPAQDPDWPCAQIFVSEVSAAVVWDGPPVEAAAWKSQEDAALSRLVARLSARTTPIAEAETLIQRFAQATPAAERNRRLTLLFAGTLHRLNHERAQLQRGIKRFARDQQRRAQRIQQTLNESADKDSHSPDTPGGAADVHERLAWQKRMFEDRERQVSYLCEQPRLVEERIGTLARTISAHLL